MFTEKVTLELGPDVGCYPRKKLLIKSLHVGT